MPADPFLAQKVVQLRVCDQYQQQVLLPSDRENEVGISKKKITRSTSEIFIMTAECEISVSWAQDATHVRLQQRRENTLTSRVCRSDLPRCRSEGISRGPWVTLW